MSRPYRKYTDDEIRKAVSEVTSMRQLLTKLGLKEAGGNYHNLRKTLQKLGLKCEHWTGQAWNKDQQLKDWSQYTRAVQAKPHLIRERGHECERCHLKEWQGEKIPLELEHINGNRTDNRKENLKLLCCNCHALTTTWRGRNARTRPIH